MTPEQLAAFAPHCDAPILAPPLNGAFAERQINTPLRQAHFLAQASVESMGFTRFVENLNYSARRICQVWPSRFGNLVAATPYAYEPEKLADAVYGGRMGNIEPDDGFRFRGRGIFQLTGRENYRVFGEIVGLNLLEDPDKAGEPVVAPRIAAAFWAMHGLNEKADADDLRGITLAINGGLASLEDRREALKRAKTALGVA